MQFSKLDGTPAPPDEDQTSMIGQARDFARNLRMRTRTKGSPDADTPPIN